MKPCVFKSNQQSFGMSDFFFKLFQLHSTEMLSSISGVHDLSQGNTLVGNLLGCLTAHFLPIGSSHTGGNSCNCQRQNEHSLFH